MIEKRVCEEILCVTPDEARKMLHVSKGKMYEKLRNGEIPHIRNGRRYLIVKSLLYEYLKTQVSESMDTKGDGHGEV